MKSHSQSCLATFTERQREQALERFALLRQHLEDGVPLSVLARVSEISLSTLPRWDREYREAGLSGLVPQRRSDGGQSRSLSEDVVKLIEGLVFQTLRRPLTSIHALVSEVARFSFSRVGLLLKEPGKRAEREQEEERCRKTKTSRKRRRDGMDKSFPRRKAMSSSVTSRAEWHKRVAVLVPSRNPSQAKVLGLLSSFSP